MVMYCTQTMCLKRRTISYACRWFRTVKKKGFPNPVVVAQFYFVVLFPCASRTAVFSQPSVFLVLQHHTGHAYACGSSVAFSGIRVSSSSKRVLFVTTLLFEMAVASF